MYIRILKLIVVFTVVFWGSSVFAMEFQTLGPDAFSMGGAGVASSRGAYAAYNNPALLPEHQHKVNVALSGVYGYRECNIAEHIDRLAEIDIDETIDEVSSLVDYTNIDSTPEGDTFYNIPSNSLSDNVAAIKQELNNLNRENGIQMTPGASLGIQAGNFGFGAYGVSEAAGSAVVDPNHLDLIYEYDDGGNTYYVEYDENTGDIIRTSQADYETRSLEYAINNGLTYIQLNGLAYVEIPVSYGHKFKTGYGDLNLGASLKIMPGYTIEHQLTIDSGTEEVEDDLDKSKEEDTSFGVDFGVLYKPPVLTGLSLGVVGKNLNSPEFDTVSGGKFEVDPQVRAGLAYDLLGGRVTFALDADLTENETFIPDYYSQCIGGGIRFQPFSWFSIRGGAMENISESYEGTVLTAGLGFGTKWLQIDISGQFSTKKAEIDGEEMPRYGKIGFSLISKWF